MDNSNVQVSTSVSLQRRNSLPSLRTLRRHSTLLPPSFKQRKSSHQGQSKTSQSSSSSSSSSYSNKLASIRLVSTKLNKSNPYVGWFRHSPPTTFRNVRFLTTPSHQTTLESLRTYSASIASHSTTVVDTASTSQSTSSSSYYNTITPDGISNYLQQTKLLLACSNNSSSSTTAKIMMMIQEQEEETNRMLSKNMRCSLPWEQQNNKSTYCCCCCCRSSFKNKYLINNNNNNKNSSRHPRHNYHHHHNNNKKDLCHLVSGHLRGGCPEREQSSATVKIITSLASWMLQLDNALPFMSDEHTVVPKLRDEGRQDSDCESSVSSDSTSNRNDQDKDDDDDDSISVYDNYDTMYGSRAVAMDYHENNNNNHTSSSSSPPPPPETIVTMSSRLDSSTLSVLSTQAEAYYAQTTVSNQLGASTTSLSSRPAPAPRSGTRLDYETITQMDIVRMTRIASRHLDVDSIWQLPTVTYQEKVVAAGNEQQEKEEEEQGRQEQISAVQQQQQQQRKHNKPSVVVAAQRITNPEFSWMMVNKEIKEESGEEGDNSTIDASRHKQENDDDDDSFTTDRHKITTTRETTNEEETMCVICLEQFKRGDRLRVLPCQHSFHVGCIDRWLSGSHSFEDCFTAGCPTCKKRPCIRTMTAAATTSATTATETTSVREKRRTWQNQQPPQDYSGRSPLEESTDGSVPSWAFARVGDALSRESRHF